MYTLKKQLNNTGIYASVSVETKKLINSNLIINFEAYLGNGEQWKNMSIAAAEVFYEYYCKVNMGNNGLEITIKNINWMCIDTKKITVFYTVIQALCLEVGIEVKDLGLDFEHGYFMFPEPKNSIVSRVEE